MKKIALGMLAAAAVGLVSDSVVLAQARPYSSPYGGWSPGNVNTPMAGGRRQMRRNNTPSLSPYLNLLPEAAGTIEGQYLLRTIPQQEFTRSQNQTQQALQGLQGELNTQQQQITTGLSTTGHRTSFMNLGSFYGGGR